MERVAVANPNRRHIGYSIWPKKPESYHFVQVLWKNHVEATGPVMKHGGWVARETTRLKRAHPYQDWRRYDWFSYYY